MNEISETDLNALRKYRDAKTSIPIEQDKRTFMRLFHKKLVTGAVSYNGNGDPMGVVRLTSAGKRALEAEEKVP